MSFAVSFRLMGLFVVLGGLPALSWGQSTNKRTPNAGVSGPTMAETEDWFQSEFSRLARGYYSSERETADGRTWSSFGVQLENVKLENCVLAYEDVYKSWYSHSSRRELRVTRDSSENRKAVRIVLGNINPQSIHVRTWDTSSGTSYDKPVKEIRFDVSDQAVEITGKDGTIRGSYGEVLIRDELEGERIIAALRHAAKLCGAKASVF